MAEAVAESASKAAATGASTSLSSASPKISTIVDQIEKLSLLEAAELVTALKVGMIVTLRLLASLTQLTHLLFRID